MCIANQKQFVKSSPWQQRLLVGALAGLSLGGAPQCWSMEDAALPVLPDFSLHGFGTLGLTRTDTDQAQFVRDLSQPNGAGTQWSPKVDSLLGLQANVQFGRDTAGVVQVVSRYHADSSYRPELTWALLRHDFSPDFSLRAGRMGTEFFMLGDSRLVGYSNISVRPPSDFYGSLVLSYIDGIDMSSTLPLASGLLKGKLFVGRSPEKTPYAPGILWDLRGSHLGGGYLDYTRGPWQLRLSHVQVHFANETPTDALLRDLGNPLAGIPYLALVPDMAMANERVRFNSLGLVYDKGPLNVQFMLNQIRHDSPAYADSSAGYAMVAYRFGALAPYMGVSRVVSDVTPLPGSAVPGVDAITAKLVRQSYTNQTSYTLGGRWDILKNVAVKAQVDAIRGSPTSVFMLKAVQPGWNGSMNVFSLVLDYVF